MIHRNKVIQSYFGSKNVNGLYQFIINRIPKHDTYVEGFLGSGIILQQKSAALKSYAFELDRSVIDKWNCQDHGFKVEILQRSFISDFEKLAVHINLSRSFVYLDPPYLIETRTSKTRYRNDLTIQQHEELLSVVLKVKTNYMISCYDSEMYSALLKEWNKETCISMTRAGARTETIYYNYDIYPAAIDSLDFAGVNFTDRQRLKRKVARHLKRLETLPALERELLLKNILRKFCS